MGDLELNVIDDVNNDKYSNTFPPEFSLYGIGAANNFTHGHYTER